MSCPDKYDLFIRDSLGEGYGLICDWSRGGAGLSLKSSSDLKSTAVSIKGNYGVRDADDYHRIIQTDWVQGCGQETWDREADSESRFLTSRNIDVSYPGEFRLGPLTRAHADSAQLPALINHGIGNTQALWGSFAAAGEDHTEDRIKWSYDGVNWTKLSNSSSPGPDASPVSFASDGETLYCATSLGTVWSVSTAQATLLGGSGITHIAYASGYLYGAKGTTSTDAQVGAFAADGSWAPITPLNGAAINAAGPTFGLVASGNYVYWGVCNAGMTRIYKVMFSGSESIDPVLNAVATFPTGFVGACMYAYLGTIYVGGHYDWASTNKGLGVIYAIVQDTPVRLTGVGEDRERDNRVLAISAYERGLYFVSDSQVWRWDLANGGYTHFSGPLDATPVLAYGDIAWDGEWTFDVTPPSLEGGGATHSGTTSENLYASSMRIHLGSLNAYRQYEAAVSSGATAGFNDATGETLEVELPAGFLATNYDNWTWPTLRFGLNGSDRTAYVRIWLSSGVYKLGLYSGNGKANTDALIGTSSMDFSAHTLRLTLKNAVARLYVDGVQVVSGTAVTVANPKKTVWLRATAPGSGWTQWDVMVDNLRWSDSGAFDPATSLQTAVSGVGLACMNDKVVAACSGVGVAYTDPSAYAVPAAEGQAPYLTSSSSSGNMPTVDKQFAALHVTTAGPLPTDCELLALVEIDGNPFPLAEDEALSTDTLHVFPIGQRGTRISDTLAIVSASGDYTPRITERAVLFTPVLRTPRSFTYYVRCWANVEDNAGHDWDEDAPTVSDWLESQATGIVTVERPGRASYNGKLEGLDYMEAPPSGKANGREGLYQLTIKEL